MSIKNFLARVFTAAGDELARAASTQVTFTAADVTAMADNIGSAGTQLTVAGASRPAENAIMAFACIIARREAVGSAPLMVTDAEDNVIESGPLVQLLEHPNGEDDWAQYIRKLETSLTLHNVCAFHIGKEVDGVPQELIPLHPEGLQAIPGYHVQTGVPRIVKWRYTDPTTREQREFDPDEVIVHLGYNPHAPLASLSAQNVLTRTIKSDLAAREQNLAMFLNDATPRGYLHTDGKSTEAQMQAVLNTWNGAYQGYLNRHKTAALWGGVKYDRVQLTPAELEFFESLRSMRIDYYMAFRVYPAMLAEMTGETGLSQGSSTESQRVAWWEDVGLPELSLIASLHQRVAERFGKAAAGLRVGRSLTRIERGVLARKDRRPRGTSYIWFNDSAIPALARMRYSRIESALKLSTGMGYLPDDANDYLQLGLPPHPDNLGRVPFSLQVVGEAAEPPQPPPPPVEEQAKTRGEKLFAALDRLENLCRADQHLSPIRKFIAKREKEVARKLSGFFIDQMGRVLKRLELHGQELNRADDSAKKAKDLLTAVFPRSEEDPQLLARLAPLIGTHLEDGIKLFQDRVGIQPANPLTVDASPALRKAIETRKIQGLKINDTTERELREIFVTAFEEGATTMQTGDMVAEYYKNNCRGENAARPMTAARTQTSGIVNEGQMIAAREAGDLLKFWIHGSPEDPRETHIDAAARYDEAHAITLEEPFNVDGDEMDAPGDSSADISNTANCTCIVGFRKATP